MTLDVCYSCAGVYGTYSDENNIVHRSDKEPLAFALMRKRSLRLTCPREKETISCLLGCHIMAMRVETERREGDVSLLLSCEGDSTLSWEPETPESRKPALGIQTRPKSEYTSKGS